MPSSQFSQLNEIVEAIYICDPRSILDIGAGFGKYGVLAREYLELKDGAWTRERWKRQIDAIEVFEKYITPLHRYIYDNVYVGEALETIPKLKARYDLVLLIDIIEHFGLEDGMRVIDACRAISRNMLVSTPHKFEPQGESLENPYEVHKSLWGKNEFRRFGRCCFIPNDYSLICFIGEDAPAIRQRFRNAKAMIKATIPALVYPYRFLKWIIGIGVLDLWFELWGAGPFLH